MAKYQPVHESSAVNEAKGWFDKFAFSEGSEADGLLVAPPENLEGNFDLPTIPPRLLTWLTGLRLLRGVPLAHLVPDPELLPPESIRFFHVDPTWVDRLVDGALSVAGIGTSDLTFMTSRLQLIRDGLDHVVQEEAMKQKPEVAWEAGKDPMTGMLIRSELVRRWPELVVRAKKAGRPARSMAILRKEAISRDVMIVLFAGQPDRVEVREPDVAMRFGVEQGNNVNLRDYDGAFVSGAQPLQVAFRSTSLRVLNVSRLATDITGHSQWDHGTPGRPAGARDVALNLEQLPYVQVFADSEPESQGSKPAHLFTAINGFPGIQFRRGRFMHVEKVVSKYKSLVIREED